MFSNTHNCSFKFHPIGQGCFFSGGLKRNNESFNFVYDCGSKSAGSYLKDSIELYQKELPLSGEKRILDLLMISHFDEDHVNGVFELLKTIKCKILVIPYISIAERLSIFSKGNAKAEWHRAFLNNPQQFLSSEDFDIDKVILVGYGDNTEDKISVDQPLKDGTSDMIVRAPVSSPPDVAESGITLGNKFQYFQIPFALKLRTWEWTFKFYIQPTNQELVRDFEEEVNRVFPSQPLNNLFKDSERLTLKGIYKAVFGDINKTSLCVSIKKDENNFITYKAQPNLYFDYDDRKSTLLLTGDSSLLNKKEVSAFTDYYSEEMPDVLVFQIPHHGSDYSSYLDPSSELWNFPVYVINHGYSRAKHPGKKMKWFIAALKKNIWNATELQEFHLAYDID